MTPTPITSGVSEESDADIFIARVATEAVARAEKAEAALAAERERTRVLKEALEPFAAMPGITCIRDTAQADVDFTRRVPDRNRRHTLRAGDFRRAARLLADRSTDTDGGGAT